MKLRDLLGVAVLVGSLAYGSMSYAEPRHAFKIQYGELGPRVPIKPYRIIDRSAKPQEYNADGTLSNFDKSINQNLEYFISKLEKSTDNSINRDMVESIDVYLETVSDRPSFLESSAEIQDVKNIVVAVRDIIAEGQKYWEHPEIDAPDYKIIFSSSNSNLSKNHDSFRLDRAIEILPLKDYRTFCSGKMQFLPLDVWCTYNIDFQSSLGESGREYQLLNKQPGVEVICHRSPILWNISKNPLVNKLETPSVEILHVQIGPYTDDAVAREFFPIMMSGKYKTMDQLGDVFAGIQKKYIACEEIFVHALHRNFFAEYVVAHPELGIDLKTLQEKMGWDKPAVRAMQEKIKAIGVSKAIDSYIANPSWINEH